MSYSREIAEAKRRARASARTTGKSYQSELEAEAKALGHNSWAELVSKETSRSLPEDQRSKMQASRSLPQKFPRLRRFITARITPLPLVLASFLAAALMIGFMRADRDESKRVMIDNFLYNEEKTLAAVLPGLQFAGYDRVSYVAAWKISPEKRKVYITIYDWRSVALSSDILFDEKLKDAPLIRFQGIVDCKSGVFENPNLHTAENLVSPSLRKMTNDAPAEKLSKQETAVLCGEEVLRKTRDIEAFHQE